MKRTDRVSRREFLRSSVGVAGASLAAATTFLESPPLLASASVRAPSDRVRFGIVGVGMEGSGLLGTAIQLPGVECAAACDLYDGRHELAREIVSRPIPTTRRYQELLDNREIDAIIVAVPDHWHKQVVIDALAAGKDVYCEKPFSHSAADGLALVSAARRSDRIVQVGAQRTSSVLCAKARELYQSGAIGKLSLVEATLGRNDPTGAWEYPPPPDLSPENLDWDTWLGTAPKKAFDPLVFARWRCWREYGTGVAGDHLPLEGRPQHAGRACGAVRVRGRSRLHAPQPGHRKHGSDALHGLEGHHRTHRVWSQLHAPSRGRSESFLLCGGLSQPAAYCLLQPMARGT